MKTVRTMLLVAASILMITSTVFAEITIQPGISVKEQYNDNLFLERSDKDDDFITTISPNIRLEYASPEKVDITLDYGLYLRYYKEHPDLNDTSIKDTQRARLSSEIRPVRHVFIDITDTYERVPVDVRRSTAIDNEFQNMTDRNVFSVSPYLMLPMTSSGSVDIGYSYSNTWHRDEEPVDSYSHSAYLALNKRLSSKINGGINYTYSMYRPESEDTAEDIDEYDRHQGSVEIEYQATGKLNFNAEAGEAFTDYKEGDNNDNLFWNAGIEYSFRDERDTVIRTEYSLSLSDSSISGAYEEERIDVYLETGRSLQFMINPFYSVSDYVNADREDEITGVNYKVSTPLTNRISAVLDGDWQEQKFTSTGVDEDVKRYSIGSTFDYVISGKITAGIGYRYNSRNSDINENDFDNNIASIEADVLF